MVAVPQRNIATVNLALVFNDRSFEGEVDHLLHDPVVSTRYHLYRKNKLPVLALKDVDVICVVAPKDDYDDFIRQLKFLFKQNGQIEILVLDPHPSAKRAVLAMKAGCKDYDELDGSNLTKLIAKVEQVCISTLFDIPKFDVESGLAAGQNLKVLHNKIRKVVQAATFLTTCRSLSNLCEGLMQTLGDALGATGGSLYLVEGEHLKQMHTLDPGHAPEKIKLPLKPGSIFEQVSRSGEPMLLMDQESIQQCSLSGWSGYKGDSVLVYPLRERDGSMIGIFSLHGKVGDEFSKEDRDLVLILSAYTHETIRALYAQEKSTRALESLQLTFENMNEGIILLDKKEQIVQFNQNVARIIGLEEGELNKGGRIGELYDLLYERGDLTDLKDVKCPWSELKRDFEYNHYCFDGKIIQFVGNYLDAGGFVLTLTDITKQKHWETELFQAKEKAEKASASKTNFLANVSHELRTPLNAIIGFSEMMTKEVFGALQNEHYTEYVHHIHESGSHLLRLINNLLDLSKVEAGKFQLHKEILSPANLIEGLGTYFKHQAAEADVNLVLETGAEDVFVYADENALRQICINLISNAIKFSPKGGNVRVDSGILDDKHIYITVEDDGIGMAPKSVDLALQPFGQVENAFNRKYPGTGLGLPLVKSLAEIHGGELKIDSQLGRGTTCQIILPRSES